MVASGRRGATETQRATLRAIAGWWLRRRGDMDMLMFLVGMLATLLVLALSFEPHA